MLKLIIILFVTLFITSCSRNKNVKKEKGNTKENQVKPSLNFYIEDGKSMHGYFTNEKSELRTTLPKILSIGQNLNEFNLHFIRYSQKTKQCRIKKNIAIGEKQIQNKLDKLETQSFEIDIDGGSGYRTIFDSILKNQKKNEVVGLLSDFIPAGEYKSLEDPLNSFLKEKISKDSTFSIAIIKLKSRFKGSYFRNPEPKNGFSLNQQRPYYIWFFGGKKNLENLNILNYNFLKNLAGFKGLALFTNQETKIEYSILTNTFNENTFSRDRNNSNVNSCKNIVINKNVKKVKFGIAINLSNIIIDESYKLDTTNYDYPKKQYSLLGVYPVHNNEISMGDSMVQIRPSDTSITNNIKASHILLFESINKPTELEFSIKKKIPYWLKESESNSEEYINLNINDPVSAIKTFGYENFNYVIEQNFILDKSNNTSKKYFTGKISVNSAKGSFILKLILFLIILFAIYYFYKRIKNK